MVDLTFCFYLMFQSPKIKNMLSSPLSFPDQISFLQFDFFLVMGGLVLFYVY